MFLLGVLAMAPGAARAQRLELRAGAVASSALASDAVAVGASPVEARAAPAPLVGMAGLLPLQPRWELEVAFAWAFSELHGRDAASDWSVQRLGVGQGTVGVRRALGGAGYLRGAAGAVHYATTARAIFARGSSLEPALELGAGWGRALGRLRLGAEADLQAHSFATSSLQAAGAARGGVGRAMLSLTASWGAR